MSSLFASSSLLTDLYQLTMAYGYWQLGRADDQAVFHLFFRRPPFQGGYAVAAGLEPAVDWLQSIQFGERELSYLATLQGVDGSPLFSQAFLDYLGNLTWELDVDAVPEGTVVFPHQPLLRIQGSMLQCQIVETALLNVINFQTLVATKASRICRAAGGDEVLEFGLRRAQGVDGGVSASRAAFVGGCTATSNVLAGMEFGIPVRGTHAHSWVMSFDDELTAFQAYAHAMPNNSLFLVDTYDTLQGVRHAIEVGHELTAEGRRFLGIRLDSGDLTYLSREARKLLDAAGFEQAAIVASNDLDEFLIRDIKQQGACTTVWGVGTKLATAYDQPALGGVYKLGAYRHGDGPWQRKIKRSEQTIKISIPGKLQVRRFFNADGPVADMIYDTLPGEELHGERARPSVVVDPADPIRRKQVDADCQSEDLLQPVLHAGTRCREPEPLTKIQQRTNQQLNWFHPSVTRLANPHRYPAGMALELFELRESLLKEHGNTANDDERS